MEKIHQHIKKLKKKHNLSSKTLFYMREYLYDHHIVRRIYKESFKILILASIISSFGGLSLEYIKTNFVSILPLIVLLPALNNMIGSYGTIVSSRFSTMLYENQITRNYWKSKHLKKLFFHILLISMITALIAVLGAFFISFISTFEILTLAIMTKITLIALLNTLLLIIILFFVAILFGFYFYKKKEDPNNFLIPLTTSIADFGNMIILAVLIILFF